MIGAAIGGGALGFIEKTFPAIPTVPLLGKAGTIALVGYLCRNMGGVIGSVARDVALAGAAIAGYELGKEGKISGDIMGDIPSQVRGVASQV